MHGGGPAGAGRGVFAGKYYREEDLVDMTPSITFHDSLVDATQLGRYAYASEDDDYRIVNIGAAMIFNHMPKASVTNYWTVDVEDLPDCSLPTKEAYSTFPDVDFSAQLNILQGQEIFGFYGETWFEDRDIDLEGSAVSSVMVRTTKELDQIGYCLSDVVVGPSAISGRGVFAARSFKAGEIISVSPVLIIPKHLLESPVSNTVMLNYAVSASTSDVALFAMGKMTMCNNGGASSNAEIVWFDWDTNLAGSPPSVLGELSIDELEASLYSRLDFAYRAVRDIDEGEELTIFYGADWENKWAEYIAGPVEKPFLHPIGAPNGLFPEEWNELKCFGQHCKAFSRHKFMAMTREKGLAGEINKGEKVEL